MTSDHHDLFIEFLKLKPLVFKNTESEDLTYQFQEDAKLWWQSHVECRGITYDLRNIF